MAAQQKKPASQDDGKRQPAKSDDTALASAQSAPSSGLDGLITGVRDMRGLRLFVSNVGGLRIRLGGAVPGSGFALGPVYTRPLIADKLILETAAIGSIKGYYLMGLKLKMPRLVNGLASLEFAASHAYFPRMDYYGPGADSAKTGRSNYLLENTSYDVAAALHPLPHLEVGLGGGVLQANVGRGRDDRFISTEQIYGPAQAPGIDHQGSFLRGGPFATYDNRDDAADPTSGGMYTVRLSAYSDRSLNRHSFRRLELEARHYLPGFLPGQTVALRGRLDMTSANDGQRVPFYLQPSLGGAYTLRGYRRFRFQDDNAFLAAAEYRWPIWKALGGAVFADSGKVFPAAGGWKLKGLAFDAGFGLRVKAGKEFMARVDCGFSREGWNIWIKFDNAF